jgi:sugar fermentation stimulation protein A
MHPCPSWVTLPDKFLLCHTLCARINLGWLILDLLSDSIKGSAQNNWLVGKYSSMKYSAKLQPGRWIKRYKRFFLDIETDTGVLTIHCPNTGSMKNCGSEGDLVWYSLSDNPKRKLPGTSEIVELSSGHKIGINTHLPNKLIKEALENRVVSELVEFSHWKSEVKVGNSRIDLRGENERGEFCYVEVKSMTLLEGDGQGYFPDSVTERGQKHLKELIELAQSGVSAVLMFCVQHSGIERAAPADHIDSEYGRLLRLAVENGVTVLAYQVEFTEMSATITRGLPVILD